MLYWSRESSVVDNLVTHNSVQVRYGTENRKIFVNYAKKKRVIHFYFIIGTLTKFYACFSKKIIFKQLLKN